MIVSRCLTLGRLTTNVAKNLLVQNERTSISHQVKRHVKYYYRTSPAEGDSGGVFMFEILGGVVWWWVLWHLFTNYHELLPRKFPDPSEWTDEELGIPPLEK